MIRVVVRSSGLGCGCVLCLQPPPDPPFVTGAEPQRRYEAWRTQHRAMTHQPERRVKAPGSETRTI